VATALNAQDESSAMLSAMGDALVVCNVAGQITVWNAAAERMFGWTAAEAVGQRMDMFVPERLRKRHWDGYDQSMKTGKTRYAHDVLRVPAMNKAGESLSIAFTVFMLFDTAGSVTACGSVIRDETARFNDDRALRKRLAELEAQVAAQGASPATGSSNTGKP
jgi:PAS domain S-box-containing protein